MPQGQGGQAVARAGMEEPFGFGHTQHGGDAALLFALPHARLEVEGEPALIGVGEDVPGDHGIEGFVQGYHSGQGGQGRPLRGHGGAHGFHRAHRDAGQQAGHFRVRFGQQGRSHIGRRGQGQHSGLQFRAVLCAILCADAELPRAGAGDFRYRASPADGQPLSPGQGCGNRPQAALDGEAARQILAAGTFLEQRIGGKSPGLLGDHGAEHGPGYFPVVPPPEHPGVVRLDAVSLPFLQPHPGQGAQQFQLVEPPGNSVGPAVLPEHPRRLDPGQEPLQQSGVLQQAGQMAVGIVDGVGPQFDPKTVPEGVGVQGAPHPLLRFEDAGMQPQGTAIGGQAQAADAPAHDDEIESFHAFFRKSPAMFRRAPPCSGVLRCTPGAPLLEAAVTWNQR